MSGMKVAYLVSQYPAISHIFIEREIEAVRACGVDVHTFSVRQFNTADLKSDVMRREAANTTVLVDSARSVGKHNMEFVRKHPQAFSRVARQVLGYGMPSVNTKLWQTFYLAEAIALYQHMSRAGLRHVHAHFANNGADVARLTAAIGEAVDGPDAGWMWSFTMHGSNEFEAVEKFDLAAKAEGAKAIACISDFTRSQMMRRVDPDHWSKMSVVRMSVDTELYSEPQPARDTAGRALRLVTVGRLVPEKGIALLLETVIDAINRGDDWELRIVGDGPLRPMMERIVADAGAGDRIHFTGAVGQEEMPSHYQWADVFVLPSFQEGLPVVLMEAMSTGLPVVTTRITGIPELVEEGVNGHLVTPGRADLLGEAISSLATSQAKRDAKGRAGRQTIEKSFCMDTAGREQTKFLEACQFSGKVESSKQPVST